MSKGINISVSGGQIGAVSQGDGNTITATVSNEGAGVSVEDVVALRDHVEELAATAEVSFAQVRDVQAKLSEMEQMAASGSPVSSIAAVAKSIHDNFGWAAKPLGAFLATLL